MKTIKTMLEDMKVNASDLTTEVINSILSIPTDNEEELKEYMENVINYGVQSGIVSDLIYYYQCAEFFKGHFEEIFELCNELKEETNLEIEFDTTKLCYLAYEYTMERLYNEVISMLEEELED